MSQRKSHRTVFIIGGVLAAIMFGFCFAIVPLYGLICKKTGINTTLGTELVTPAQAEAMSKNVDMSREVTVQFTATNNMGMPWDFYPKMRSIKVHPGAKNKVVFYAKNPTANNMVAQAIPSMTPTNAIEHFHKVECFCFNQQTLNAGEERDMVMIFQIDNDLPKDVHVITLAYTLFDTTPQKAVGLSAKEPKKG